MNPYRKQQDFPSTKFFPYARDKREKIRQSEDYQKIARKIAKKLQKSENTLNQLIELNVNESHFAYVNRMVFDLNECGWMIYKISSSYLEIQMTKGKTQ